MAVVGAVVGVGVEAEVVVAVAVAVAVAVEGVGERQDSDLYQCLPSDTVQRNRLHLLPLALKIRLVFCQMPSNRRRPPYIVR